MNIPHLTSFHQVIVSPAYQLGCGSKSATLPIHSCRLLLLQDQDEIQGPVWKEDHHKWCGCFRSSLNQPWMSFKRFVVSPFAMYIYINTYNGILIYIYIYSNILIYKYFFDVIYICLNIYIYIHSYIYIDRYIRI